MERFNTNDYDTNNLQERLLHCDELSSFKETILNTLRSEGAVWKDKINEIICDNGYTKTDFANLCGVSRTAVSKWCAGSLPSGRDDFIRIGFAAHYSLDEMNFFLQRFGKYPALYAKSLEDSVYIFVLNSGHLPHTYAFCWETISRIKTAMGQMESENRQAYDTAQLSGQLLNLESIEELEVFIARNVASYQASYGKFYAYVNAFIVANNMDYVEGTTFSVDLLATAQGWTSSLRQSVSAIRQKKWFPLRRKVIALGLHLNMKTSQINEMLQLAQMETLCAKNPVESAIIFAVEDADLNELICCDGGTELCEHVRGILEELEIPDADKLLNDI